MDLLSNLAMGFSVASSLANLAFCLIGVILGTLIDELERRDQRFGLATLCVGGGMGIATIVERV